MICKLIYIKVFINIFFIKKFFLNNKSIEIIFIKIRYILSYFISNYSLVILILFL